MTDERTVSEVVADCLHDLGYHGDTLAEARKNLVATIIEEERQKILLLIHGNPLAELPRGLVHQIARRKAITMHKPQYLGVSGGMPATTFASITGKMPTRREDAGGGYLVPVGKGKPPAGRNAPCPCGSGKKYKKCCLPAPPAAGQEALSAQRGTTDNE